jgi:succinyl-CoA synthetase alpha subunit
MKEGKGEKMKYKVVVQGITGRQGTFHSAKMVEYGTEVVAGTTPGKGGEEVNGIPVYDTVGEACTNHDINSSVIFVPAPFAKDAALEAISHGLDPVVVITEGIPVLDAIEIIKGAKKRGVTVIGPNTPGLLRPKDRSKLGIMPTHIFAPGRIGIISRSGTLTYEIASTLTKGGLGQSTCVGIGGDPITGTDFIHFLKLFEEDEDTEGVVLIGEIGGDAEERAADFIRRGYKKRVAAFIAGKTAPKGKRMGHAGAIISGESGYTESKVAALKDAGVEVCERPGELLRALRNGRS